VEGVRKEENENAKHQKNYSEKYTKNILFFS
jgi:hypothetical protein